MCVDKACLLEIMSLCINIDIFITRRTVRIYMGPTDVCSDSSDFLVEEVL